MSVLMCVCAPVLPQVIEGCTVEENSGEIPLASLAHVRKYMIIMCYVYAYIFVPSYIPLVFVGIIMIYICVSVNDDDRPGLSSSHLMICGSTAVSVCRFYWQGLAHESRCYLKQVSSLTQSSYIQHCPLYQTMYPKVYKYRQMSPTIFHGGRNKTKCQSALQ